MTSTATHATKLSAAELIGDQDAPVGSRLWCIAMRYRIQKLLESHEQDHESLQMCVSNFVEQRGWKELRDKQGHPFLSYSEFCKTRIPHGLGRDPAEIDALIAEGRAKAEQTARDLANDPVVGAQRTRSEAMMGNDNASAARAENSGDKITTVSTSQRGTSAEYWVRRLKREAAKEGGAFQKASQSALEGLQTGRLTSARAAAIEAGLFIPPTPFDIACTQAIKMGDADLEAFFEFLESEDFKQAQAAYRAQHGL